MPHRLSAYRTVRSRTGGFTLAELLVVVAIVAVLVAIAVPVFTSALGNTEEAACSANRRSVKALYTTSWLLDQKQNQSNLFDACFAKLKGQNKGVLCPSYTGDEPEYTARFTANGDVIVRCKVHGLSVEDEYNNWFADYDGPFTDDESVRKAYAKDIGIDEWPPINGLDGKKYYLQFKSYDHNIAHAFLYAGPSSTIENRDSWRAKYLCDSNGLNGTPGQWYELPKVEGISMYGDGAEQKLIDLMKTGTPINFVNGEFKPA